MPVEQVSGIIALLTLPWVFKFLWAPAIDRVRGPRWGHRHWITVAQVAMGATLIPLGLLDGDTMQRWAVLLLLGHAFSAATQDVAIDALAIATIPEAERAGTTGWMQAGMLVGRALFGGVALAAEARFGARAIIFTLVGCIWFSMLVLWLMPGADDTAKRSERATGGTLKSQLATMLARRSTWIGLGIALTAGAGFEAIGGLIGPLLIDRGALQSSIGWFMAGPVVALMVLGGLLGGFMADRLGHRRLVVGSVLAIAGCVTTVALLQSTESVGSAGLMLAVAPMYLFIGSLTAASYALFMDLSDESLGGTQFSLFMAATNGCEVWAIALAGSLAGVAGYGVGFVVAGGLSLIAVPLVARLGRQPSHGQGSVVPAKDRTTSPP